MKENHPFSSPQFWHVLYYKIFSGKGQPNHTVMLSLSKHLIPSDYYKPKLYVEISPLRSR